MADSNGECAMADEKAFDATRTLLLTGLEELENNYGTCDEKNQLLKEAVQNLMAELYTLPIDTVEKVAKTTNDEGNPAAMVLFKSRLNKNRVYTQREKLPKTVKATLKIVHKIAKKEESTEKKDESPTLSTAVEEQSGNDLVVKEQVGEEELDEKEILGDEEMEKNEEPETEENPRQSIIEADKHDTDDHMPYEAEDKHDPDDMDEHEQIEDEENTGSDQKIKGSDEPNHSTDSVDWNGCPEFQWKRVSANWEERAEIIVDNVSVSDLQNPWLYQTVLHARSVTFKFLSKTYKEKFDHNVLRKGRLILGFGSDRQAMAQATSSLVYLRTPQHRRIKIFLPQTPLAMKQSKLLEEKMGQLLELDLFSRQLLVRNISDTCDEELIKLRFGVAPNEITKTEFRKDGLGRRCVVVTFATPELATWTHMKHDLLKVGAGTSHLSKVFYMRDILPIPLMLRQEVNLNLDRVKFNLQDGDDSPEKATEETKSESKIESNAEKLHEDAPSSGDGGAKGSPAAAKAVKSVEKEKESAKRSYPERRVSDSRSADRKRQRSRSPVPFSKRPAIQSDRGRGRGRGGGFRDFNGPPRGRGHRPFRGSARGGGRGFDRGRGDFNRGRSSGRGDGRTNPWSPMEGGSLGGASLDSMQKMIAEQQRQLEMQQQLLKQQETLDKIQMEIDRRTSASTSNYNTGYYDGNRGNIGRFSGSAMGSSGSFLPMTSTAMGASTSGSFSTTPYGRGPGPSGQTGNRGYSPPIYQSPMRGSRNYRN